MAVAPFGGGPAPFYVVSDRFQKDHPRKAFHWAMCQLNSMDKEHVLKHHVHLGLSIEEWAGWWPICSVRHVAVHEVTSQGTKHP